MFNIKKFLIVLFAISFFYACNEEQMVNNGSGSLESTKDYSEQLAKRHRMAEFEITLENLTPATGPGASQPFSPPVFVTHTPRYHVFQLHRYATEELGQIAEDAVSGPMIEKLNNDIFAYDVVQGENGPVFPGSMQKFMIKTKLPFVRFSMVAMLVNTNDAFTGVDAARLPLWGSKVYYLKAYDAGTEMNTELKANIPGPCCGSPHVRVPTHELIKYHTGILGVGDLDPKIFDWDNPVAKLTITRVK